MNAPVLVIGHKNPDNDAICSAIGYAWLKNELVHRGLLQGNETAATYVPARLGPLPRETAGVLKKWGIEAPMVVNNLFTRVSDVMTEELLCIDTGAKVIEAGRILRKHNVEALVVRDEAGIYQGLASARMIAIRYISACETLDKPGASEMAVAADLISSLDQPVTDIMEEKVIELDADTRLDEAAVELMAQSLSGAIVLDEERRPIGIMTRSDIARRPKRKVVLVDHNEIRQAADGIEEAEVLEIIDHHRIADVSTANPIRFINMPVGSSATIVTLEAQRQGVEIPRNIAAVLLSAVMTDTVLLKSPTATPIDEQVVEYLASIVDVDPTQFGMEVFSYRSTDDDMPIEKLVEADSKEFSLGESVVLIAQHETTNLKQVMSREREIRDYMRSLVETRGYECALLMVTDIIAEGSQFLCEGNPRIVNRAFDIDCSGEGGVWMPGILSRKLQVATRILSV